MLGATVALMTGTAARAGDGERLAAGAPAAVAVPAVSVERGLRYGPARAMVLDVYRPAGPGHRAAPAVLVAHGGGWAGGDQKRMAGVASALAEAGLVAVNVNYSLATWWRPGFPKQLSELRRAVRWMRRNADRLGVDARRIGALGSSAGGHLVALLGVRSNGRLSAGDRVAAAVTWSAPLDLARPGEASLAPAIETFLGCSIEGCARRAAAASPAIHVTADDPAMLIVHSDEELVPLEHALGMAADLAKVGVRHRLMTFPGRRHAMAYAGAALGPSIDFLRRRLR
jgi:acetyl esterase